MKKAKEKRKDWVQFQTSNGKVLRRRLFVPSLWALPIAHGNLGSSVMQKQIYIVD